LVEVIKLLSKRIKTIEITSAISGIISVISMIITIACSYFYREQTSTIEEYLEKIVTYQTGMRTEAISSLLSGVFLFFTAIGLFVFLRRKINPNKKNLSIIPFLSILLGSLVMISISVIRVYLVFYVAQKYNFCVVCLKSYFLDRATKLISITNILSAITHVLTFTLGAGSIGVLLYSKNIINDAFIWTGLASGVLGLAKIFYFVSGTVGAVFIFLASVGSILFYFFICGMIYVILKEHINENKQNNKSSINDSLLE
jgi:hypothetical protein